MQKVCTKLGYNERIGNVPIGKIFGFVGIMEGEMVCW